MDQNQNENKEKVLTKYDRKVLQRQQAIKDEKRHQLLTTIISIVVIAALISLAVILPAVSKKLAEKDYIKVNDTSITGLEFNYYQTSVLNSYSQLLPYFGVDTSKSLAEQYYDEENDMTWADFFAQQASETIRSTYAVLKDIEDKNLTFDTKAKYDETIAAQKEAAKEAKLSYSEYLKTLYGSSASEKALKPIITKQLKTQAYYDKLMTDMAVSDEAVQTEYKENVAKYDSFDYRMLSFTSSAADDATEEEKAAAKADAKAKADEMLEKLKAGEDFETLCAAYAPEDKKSEYADEATDKSLITAQTAESVVYKDWLLAEERKDGDVTVYSSTSSDVFYVLKFGKRYLGDTVMESIKTNLTNEVVNEYLTGLSKDVKLSDPKGNVKFLQETIASENTSDDTTTE